MSTSTKVTMGLLCALASGCGATATERDTRAHTRDAARARAGDAHGPVRAHGSVGGEAPRFVEAEVHAVSGAFESVMPTALTSFGGATLTEADGTRAIYLAGGYSGAPHQYSREGQSQALWRYGRTNEGVGWSARAPLEGGVQGLALVAHEGALVRCGGSRMDNASGEPTRQRALADCARWVPARDAWEAFPPLPAPRSSFDAVSVAGRVVAVGGWNVQGDPSSARFHDTVALYESGAWREIPAPFRRRALAVAVLGDEVVAVGGMNADQSMSRDTMIFDVAREAWRAGPAYPGDAFGLAAVGAGDAVFASGRDGVVHRLGRDARAWEPVGTLAEGASSTASSCAMARSWRSAGSDR
jgi:hypothetical protein